MASWEAAAFRIRNDGANTGSQTTVTSLGSYKPLSTTGIKDVSTVDGSSNSRGGWKPLSLSTPILLAVITLTLLLAAAVETLAQRSQTQGGLALSPSVDDFTAFVKLSYLYVPNIIAVLYSMVWSWIDLDVKRMQPWFELSKPSGATAKDSVFLDYPYDFVAFVPYRAVKKR